LERSAWKDTGHTTHDFNSQYTIVEASKKAVKRSNDISDSFMSVFGEVIDERALLLFEQWRGDQQPATA
jgi:hypothetical protein